MTGHGDSLGRESLEAEFRERERLITTVQTDDFINWLAVALEERSRVTDEDLAYESVQIPDSHPEYKQAFSQFVGLVIDYAHRNYLSFLDREKEFPNENAYMSHNGSAYFVGSMFGQGSALWVSKVDDAEAAKARDRIIPFADIKANVTTKRAEEAEPKLKNLGEVVTELVDQGLPWYAIEETIKRQKPRAQSRH